MATTVLVGAQWGDAGKGKIIDVLDSLPKRARLYLQRLAQLSSARLSIVSVGARWEETIFLS